MSETPATTKASSVYSDLVEADKRSILAKVLSADFLVDKKKSQITPTVKADINGSDQVDADGQSILAKALNTDLFKVSRLVVKSKNAEENEKAIESDIEEEIKSIFHEDAADDGEEVFQKILKSAEEAFKREMTIKAKNPFLYEMMTQQTKAPSQPRKRKCNKLAENAKNMIQLFRKSLAEAKTPVRSALTDASTVNSKRGNKTKSSNDYITPIGNRNQVKTYPAWKTTANYTPIFSRSTNPKWTKNNEIFTTNTKSSNLYTPNHIYNWIEDKVNTDLTGPSSERTTPKSHKSNNATCQSMTSPMKSPTLLSTTLIGSPTISNNFMLKKRIASSTPIRGSPTMESTSRKNPIVSSISTRKSILTSSTSIRKSSWISRTPSKSPVISSISMPRSPIMLSSPMSRNPNRSNTSIWKSPITLSPVQRNPITSSTSVQSPFVLSPLERKSPITFSSPPTRNTVVRFRPSPPEYITYSGDCNMSASSSTFFFEENNEFKENSSEPDEFYTKDYESCSHYFQEYSKKYENAPENQQQSSNQYKTDHYCYVDANNDEFNVANKNNFYTSAGKQPFSIDEFMRNLNHNIMMRHRNSANNMEVKYSMRVKLF